MLPKEKCIHSKEQLNDWLSYELEKYPAMHRGGGIIRKLYPISENDVLKKHIVLLRKAEYYTNTNKRIRASFYMLMLNRFQNKYSIHVPMNCCEKGLKIMHVGPILINGKAVVGQDCSLHINTALVAGSDGVPVLEDGVVMGIGSVIVGAVRVAKYTAVGANAVVTKDILEENTAVAGVPAKKVSNRGRLDWASNKKNY